MVRIGRRKFREAILQELKEGEMTTRALYRQVKSTYRSYCDDRERCLHYKSQGARQPEWKHEVRRVPHELKMEALIERSKGTGKWKLQESYLETLGQAHQIIK